MMTVCGDELKVTEFCSITVNVAQTHIDRHGANLIDPRGCPIFHAMKEMGLDVDFVLFDSVCINGTEYTLPGVAWHWQTERLLTPFSFEMIVNAELVRVI